MNRTEYLLTCLAEEAAEVAQACSKALRFGLTDQHPTRHLSARDCIVAELNDMAAIIELLKVEGVLPPAVRDDGAIAAKEEKVARFMEYSRQCGALQT